MDIFWIKINKLKYKDFFSEITSFKKQSIVFTPNPEILLKIRKDLEFKSILQEGDYRTPDGIWLYIAYQILDNNYWKIINFLLFPFYFFRLFFFRNDLYKKYWERICWSDITKDLLDFAQKNRNKVVIIDLYNPTDKNKVESQRIMKERLKSKYSDIDFLIHIYNPFDKDFIIEDIKKFNPEILFTTLWMKEQEKVLLDIMHNINSIKIWAAIWSSIDYLIWFQKRAPKIFRSLGIEWLYRLITWPRKIDRLKRIYNAIFVFIFTILKSK